MHPTTILSEFVMLQQSASIKTYDYICVYSNIIYASIIIMTILYYFRENKKYIEDGKTLVDRKENVAISTLITE